jgi:phospholipid/cholesterol/gamma-HCH transport system substrate-binding protein
MAGLLTRRVIRLLAAALTLAVVAGVAYHVLHGKPTKKLTAHFSSAVGIYPGSDVRLLGIKIGTITKVSTTTRDVVVRMKYSEKYKIPADAVAIIVPPSIVSDRYVQLTPVYRGGAVLASPGDIPMSRTAVPVELDDIYSALNTLSTALGPNGANEHGALSDLVKVASANLQGNGAALGQSLTDLSHAAQTLANGRNDLTGTVKNLAAFTTALANSDAQVRHFNDQLAQVAGNLAADRQNLAAALRNLSVALTTVSTFVRNNQASIHSDITGLVSLTGILVKQRAALNESLAVAPVAVANLAHTYNPSSGTLDNRTDLRSLTDPAGVCGLLDALGNGLPVVGKLPIVSGASQTILQACQTVAGQLGGGLPSIPGVTTGNPLVPVLNSLGIPSIPGVS